MEPNQRVNRVNRVNRPTILQYIRESFDRISATKGGRVSLVDIWDVEMEAQTRFGISDYQSEKLTRQLWELTQEQSPRRRPSTRLPKESGRMMVAVPVAIHARMERLKGRIGIPYAEMVKRAMEAYLKEWD
jgi:hypothetical protein